ncbi:FkbM family methyltransferase [Marmoricola sp. Leaf446]|uniref:FkbM family methyltransferase n=1 Tax=Marmoricola sp. Leaf446 TaxID=1736379 RepID=UPI00138F5E97|nr:FkbM family methyltransferase [Marmoricola sp. Leaf446]
MLASLDSSASILAAYARQPDYAEWQVWKRFLSVGDVFVDVGSNIGTYSVLAAEVGAYVISVEPDPVNVSRLRHNLELNNYQSEIWECALTARKTTLSFSEELDSMNHIVMAGQGRAVLGERFDDRIAGRHVRGMKVDVEGAERQVVIGALEALRGRRIDLLQLEWNECAQTNFGESRAELKAVLDEVGYELYRPTRAGKLVPTGSEEGTDVFAARPEAVASLL